MKSAREETKNVDERKKTVPLSDKYIFIQTNKRILRSRDAYAIVYVAITTTKSIQVEEIIIIIIICKLNLTQLNSLKAL